MSSRRRYGQWWISGAAGEGLVSVLARTGRTVGALGPRIAGFLLILSSAFAAWATGQRSVVSEWAGSSTGAAWLLVQASAGCWLLRWPGDPGALFMGTIVYTGFVVYIATRMVVTRDPSSFCPCFAFWSPPLWQTFMADALLLGTLLGRWPGRKRGADPGGTLDRVLRAGVVAAAVLVVSAAAGRTAPSLPNRLGISQVIVNPARWFGTRPNILSLFDLDAARVGHGRWLLVFVHGRCKRCHRFARALAQGAEAAFRAAGVHVLLLDVDVPGEVQGWRWPLPVSRLRGNEEAVRVQMPVPTVVLLDDGSVVAVAVQPQSVREVADWILTEAVSYE